MRRILIGALALLVGIAILAYPHVSSYFNEKNSSYVAEGYQEKVQQLTEEKRVAALKEAQVYNENLTGRPVHDPFVPGSGVAMPDNYYKVLNVDGMMGVLEIPKINVKLTILHGTSEQVLKKTAGHMEGSTLPVGGESSHAVITGHTGLSHAKIFTNLIDLELRDMFYLQVLGETMAYQIDQIKVIEPKYTEDLKVIPGEDHVTLLTCTPYSVNSHRLLVRGIRVPYSPKEKEAIQSQKSLTAEEILLLKIAAATAGVMLLLILWRIRQNRSIGRGSNETKKSSA
ncbi:class C sortase [Candidatus Enterococcus leclercqii]|uniref:class C sortase n=1 Tax=Candidatus Enterococcus leclercqii TaxID=1857218 RepID=UPI00137A7675|nr:class C sortase [Enterococcus sp. CU9D]KAF1294394.1 class C sortase [Enterococcus sp. CU9D]